MALMRAATEDDFATSEGLAKKIVAFLESIGLRMEFAAVEAESFLPGIELVSGGLRIDFDHLLYPGDLLHEAGHLAVMEPARRNSAHPVPKDAGEEMAAIAWSYAAALHLGVAAEVVFHPDGYKGGAAALCSNFRAGRYIGVPMLQWMGLTTEARPDSGAQQPAYPQMKVWLRR